jgi:hypothetical protein
VFISCENDFLCYLLFIVCNKVVCTNWRLSLLLLDGKLFGELGFDLHLSWNWSGKICIVSYFFLFLGYFWFKT